MEHATLKPCPYVQAILDDKPITNTEPVLPSKTLSLAEGAQPHPQTAEAQESEARDSEAHQEPDTHTHGPRQAFLDSYLQNL